MASENLESCALKKEYLEFCKEHFANNDPVGYLLCGSFFELPILYFFSNPTDVDIMFCDNRFCCVNCDVIVPVGRKRNVLTIRTTGCHIGFVRLRKGLEYFRKPYDFDNGPACTNELSINGACLRAILGKKDIRWRDICMITKDSVYAISCPVWPQDAREWITRKRKNGWPSEETITAIVKSGCHLVSKPHARNPNDDTQWRYSFSHAETILIHNYWTDVQKYIYHLLKIIKREVVQKCGGEGKTFISNYYFKTLMLWACEEKPSEFWEERNIVASVRELLLDFIEKLIERNVPHYFMPANNIMDGLPRKAEIDCEICSMLSYGENEIVELVRMEPKAYRVTTDFIVMPNQSLYPLLAIGLLSHSFYPPQNKVDKRQLEELRIFSMHSSNYFFPELEYVYRGIIIHLQLSKLNRYENKRRRHDFITFAEDLFNLSIQKLDYGFTGFRCHLGWSISEIYQQLWLSCGGEQFQNESLMLYSGSCAPNTTSASCDVRDEDFYLKNHRSIAPNSIGTGNVSILQQILLKEIALPFNATYFVCSAYRANFFFNALCNYRRTLDFCEEVNKQLYCLSDLRGHLFVELLPFPLKYEWSGLYDK